MGTLPNNKIRMAIFASGTGSNAEALLRHAQKNNNLWAIDCIITDNPEAKVIEKAQVFGIKTHIFSIKKENFDSFSLAKTNQENKIIEFLKQKEINWVLLAGYMRILSAKFLDHFYNPKMKVSQVVNIHPSLLPAFPGKDGYGDAFCAKVDVSGITIHFVDNGIDTGPIIMQEKFHRNPEDSLEDFKNRGLALEHKCYPIIFDKIINETVFSEELS